MVHEKEKYKSIESVPAKDLTADILDKDFKTTVLPMLKELEQDVEKVKNMMCEQNGNVSDTENLKRNQKEIMQLKGTITEMKNSYRYSKADLSW